jgi:predicted DNA-binding protein (MmcQ/YjbR family)
VTPRKRASKSSTGASRKAAPRSKPAVRRSEPARSSSRGSDALAILTRLRKLALALPGATETVTFGHPTFQVAKRTFAVLEEYQGELCLVFKTELPRQQELVLSPRFFVAPYVGKHGWVSQRVHAAPLDWKEIEGFVTESWRLVGPRSKAPPGARTRARTRRTGPRA